MKKFKVKSGSSIPEGAHSGTIVGLEERTSPNKGYKYIDVVIALDDVKQADGNPMEMTYGCPAPKTETVNPKSDLGLLLGLFANLEEYEDNETEVDIEKILLNNKIKFMTLDKEGGFSKIVKESVKKA